MADHGGEAAKKFLNPTTTFSQSLPFRKQIPTSMKYKAAVV